MTRAVQRVFSTPFKEAAVSRIMAGESVSALAVELVVSQFENPKKEIAGLLGG